MLLHVLLGGSLLYDLIGILAGHLYYFLDTIVPEKYGTRFLKTPSLLYSLFPPTRVAIHGMQTNAPQQRIQNPFGARFPGRGRQLAD